MVMTFPVSHKGNRKDWRCQRTGCWWECV